MRGKLKKCPMCGSDAIIKTVKHEGLDFYMPICISCGLSLPEMSTKRNAELKWNERA